MNPEQWTLTDGVYTCHRHPDSEPFERGEVCHACASDPGPRLDVRAGAVEDVEARTVEAEVRQLAKEMKRTAEALLDGTGREQIDAVKFADSFAKLTRLWNEMHADRMQNEADARREELAKRLSGIRGHN